MNDVRTRFIFEELPIRGVLVDLSQTFQYIVSLKIYPKVLQKLMAELLAASVLLVSTIKFNGQLILQIQSEGCLKLLTAEATSYRSCRATAKFDDQSTFTDKLSFSELLGDNAIFVVTLQPENGAMWQSRVPLEGKSIAEILSYYMQQSEQLETYFQFSLLNHKLHGILLQKLPSENDVQMREVWEGINVLAHTLTTQELAELPLPDLLRLLFNGFDISIYDPEPFEFRCQCSRDKTAKALLLLGKEEVKNILLEQVSIQMNCEYCGNSYVFDAEDSQKIFGFDVLTENRH